MSKFRKGVMLILLVITTLLAVPAILLMAIMGMVGGKAFNLYVVDSLQEDGLDFKKFTKKKSKKRGNT